MHTAVFARINENSGFPISEAYGNERLGFPRANGNRGIFISQGPMRIGGDYPPGANGVSSSPETTRSQRINTPEVNVESPLPRTDGNGISASQRLMEIRVSSSQGLTGIGVSSPRD